MIKSHLKTPSEMDNNCRQAMFQLFSQFYNKVTWQQFITDLEKKDYILLLKKEEAIVGFTTFAINPSGTGTSGYNILFSGDTIMHPQDWSSLSFIKHGFFAAGQIMASRPDDNWYWFLMSKGHRTYMFLPLFFEKYIPHSEGKFHEELFPVLDLTAAKMFGKDWKRKKGVIEFGESHGELNEELAKGTFEKNTHPQVAFFLEKNPAFNKGVELACLAPLYLSNMKGYARNCLEKGLDNPFNPS